jgi:glycosyltransferase involved in cell wall biosynthesis
MKYLKTFFKWLLVQYGKLFEFIIILPTLKVVCYCIGRFGKKSIDIGLGPEPLINNIYHKQALEKKGYSVETFVNQVYHIVSAFDYRGDQLSYNKTKIGRYFTKYYLFLRAIRRYRCIYIYFNGGPLYTSAVLKKYEPSLLKLSRTKVVVMPYGSDVQIMSQCPNLLFKHAMVLDYPETHKSALLVEAQIYRWTTHADHVISGCDWVDYTYHWDTLTLAHFSIDVDKFAPYRKDLEFYNRDFTESAPLRVLHAPNHRTIKGTDFFIKAIEELKSEGHPIELVLIQGKSNSEVLEEMSNVDVVADQLIVGWYAMFALEAMSMGKPVICYLRKDLVELYLSSGNLESLEEIPHINSSFLEVKNNLLKVLNGEISLRARSLKGMEFVNKYHSLEYIGEIFHKINLSLEIAPSKRSVT